MENALGWLLALICFAGLIDSIVLTFRRQP